MRCLSNLAESGGEVYQAEFDMAGMCQDFVKVPNLNNNYVCQIACGAEHTILLTTSGFMYTL